MENTTLFLNMFPDFAPPEALLPVLSQAAIVAGEIDPVKRGVSLVLHTEDYIPQWELDGVAQAVAGLYGLESLHLQAVHPASQLTKIHPRELMELFVREDSLSRAALAGAGWRWEGNTLHIQLRANGKKALEACVTGVCRSLGERFATQAQVEIHSGENLEGAQLYAAMEQMRQNMMESIPQPGGKTPEKAQPQQAQQSQTIYGKPFQGKPIPMSEVDLNQGFVIVEGKVFHVEHKELKKNNAWVINFDMTDYTGSVRVNRYMDNNEAKPILEAVREGSVIQVKGT